MLSDVKNILIIITVSTKLKAAKIELRIRNEVIAANARPVNITALNSFTGFIFRPLLSVLSPQVYPCFPPSVPSKSNFYRILLP